MKRQIHLERDVLVISKDLEIKIRFGTRQNDFSPMKKCPKCLEMKLLSDFGLRYMAHQQTIRPQSLCRSCRSIKKAK